jgi:hypothetical protein
MKIQKAIAGLAAIAALTATAAMPSMASSTFASATTIFSNFQYTSGSTGGLKVAQTNQFSSDALPALSNSTGNLNFTGLKNSGTVETVIAGVEYGENLTGGTFTLVNGANTLLTGTFTSAIMQGYVVASNDDASVSFFGVAYTGGSYFTAAEGLGYANPGGLSLALLSNTHLALNHAGTYFSNFNASGTGTFGATPPVVPEPGTVASFTIGALGLCVLMLRGRKVRSMNGLAA